MAHNLGDRIPLDLTKLLMVGKNTKTACYVRINVREYRRRNQKGTIQRCYTN